MLPDIVSADNQPHDFFVRENGKVTAILTIHPTYTLTLPNGRVYRFEWHKFCGPLFVRKDDEPLARFPSERNPMWDYFGMWIDQGKMVDTDGNCVYEVVQLKPKIRRKRNKNFSITFVNQKDSENGDSTTQA